MKILLVTFYEPAALGVRYLAASLLAHGHEAHILQMKNWVESMTEPDLRPDTRHSWTYTVHGNICLGGPDLNPTTDQEKKLFATFVEQWAPDVVGFSIRGVFKELVPPLAALARKACPKALLISGGPGSTLEPKYFLDAGLDAAFRGEGEAAIVDFVSRLRDGGGGDDGGGWRDCANISYRNKNATVHNPMRPLLHDLDALPFPLHNPEYFSCIESDRFFPRPMEECGIQTQSFAAEGDFPVMTSRGCLEKCAYCGAESLRQAYSAVPGTPRMRLRSLDKVMLELQERKENGARFISFWDDFLVRKTDRLIAFFNEYKDKIGLPFFAQFYPQQLQGNPEIIDAAVEAGITQFYFGIQSASPDFCKKVYHRDFSAWIIRASCA